MSSVISRRVAASPQRASTATWTVIMDLLASNTSSQARRDLERIAGTVCCVIAAEATKDDPIVVWGSGPRVRVYNIFGEDAITGDGVNEDRINSDPTSGDWRMSIPCHEEDLKWIQDSFSKISSRVSARTVGSAIPDADEDEKKPVEGSAKGAFTINMDNFLKP